MSTLFMALFKSLNEIIDYLFALVHFRFEHGFKNHQLTDNEITLLNPINMNKNEKLIVAIVIVGKHWFCI